MTNEEIVVNFQTSQSSEERRQLLEELYLRNLPFIQKVAGRYAWHDDLPDLLQESFFGIALAAEKWSPEGGACFLGYAETAIKQACRKYLNQGGRPVRLPQHVAEHVAQYQIYLRDYLAKTGTQPSDFEIITQLDLTAGQLKDIRSAMEMMQPRSTSEPIPGTDDLTLEDMIADPEDPTENVINELWNEELSKAIREAAAGLNDQERKILRNRFRHEMSMAAAGEDLGLTAAQARQIENAALRKLRKQKNLKAFLEETAEHYAYHMAGVNAFKQTGSSAVELAILRTEERYGNKR